MCHSNNESRLNNYVPMNGEHIYENRTQNGSEELTYNPIYSGTMDKRERTDDEEPQYEEINTVLDQVYQPYDTLRH